MPTPYPPTPTSLLVACLCADWCGTCREYHLLFDQLARQMPGVQFVWVDVEDESDLVDPIEVEDFPTILIASPTQALFFGTVLPHIQTLQRLIETQQTEPSHARAANADVQGLVRRLWQRAATN